MRRLFTHRMASLLCLALIFGQQTVQAAEEKPLWEIGAGVAALSFPAYRGSNETKNLFLPVPHFTYHGEFFKADREGVRGSLFDSDRVDLTISLALSPPASSDDVTARAGMTDLHGSFEIGPQLDLTLWRSANRARFVKLRLPLRAAFTLESTPQDIGLVFHPKLNMDVRDLPGMAGWNLGLKAGPLFGDQRQHAYYYSVAPQFATANRPAYDAQSGYGGMQYLAALSKRFPKYWIGGFVRYDSLSGATFDDSPLVQKKDYFAAGIAVTWILGESSTRVLVDD
jgi:outer membrane scaffolding protein for murein synthesis (MipA/OmpV family)